MKLYPTALLRINSTTGYAEYALTYPNLKIIAEGWF